MHACNYILLLLSLLLCLIKFNLVWFRKGRICDLLSADEFGVVPRGSGGLRTIWNYNKGKNRSCPSSQEGTFKIFKNWLGLCLVASSSNISHIVTQISKYVTLLIQPPSFAEASNVVVLKASCHHFSWHPYTHTYVSHCVSAY